MKAMRNPYPGASRLYQDTDGVVYVVVYPTFVKGTWNWGINPGLLLRLWNHGSKKVYVDLVPPGERRDLPYKPGVISRGELMQRLNKNGEFNQQLGFYRLFVDTETL